MPTFLVENKGRGEPRFDLSFVPITFYEKGHGSNIGIEAIDPISL